MADMKKRLTFKRIAVVFFVAFFLVATLLSSLYIAKELDHECDGSDCEICTVVRLCEETLKFTGTVSSVIFLAFITAEFVEYFAEKTGSSVAFESLIALKIRFNN